MKKVKATEKERKSLTSGNAEGMNDKREEYDGMYQDE